jgi:hypothetical protein
VEQLRGAGLLLSTDEQGRVHAQAADGRDPRVLGQLGELAGRRAPSGLDLEAAAQVLAAPDDRPAEVATDADQVYLRTGDGAAAVGRLSDGSLRRLVPAGWKSPGPPRHAADGSVLGVCGYRLGGSQFPTVTAATSWVLDGSGTRLATLPGCLYDLARCPWASSTAASRSASPTSTPGACGCGGATAASGPCSASTRWCGPSGPSSRAPTRPGW